MDLEDKKKEFDLAKELKNSCEKHDKYPNKLCEINPKESAKILHELGLLYMKQSPNKFSLIRSAGLLNAAIIRKASNVDQIKKDLQQLCSHVLEISEASNKNTDLIKIADHCKRLINIMRVDVERMLSKLEKNPWRSCGTKTKNCGKAEKKKVREIMSEKPISAHRVSNCPLARLPHPLLGFMKM